MKALAERAEATKAHLERQLAERRREQAERRDRRIAFSKALADPSLSAEEKKRMQAEFDARERELLRESRKRYSPADFEVLCVIGRGAFGEVTIVRGKEDGKIYAMKKMSKVSGLNSRKTDEKERD